MKGLTRSLILLYAAATIVGCNSYSRNNYDNRKDITKIVKEEKIDSVIPDVKKENISLDLIIKDMNPFQDYQVKDEYQKIKNNVDIERDMFSEKYVAAKTQEEKTQVINKARDYLTKTCIEDLAPLWLGTKYDYNGNTPIPKKGKIACGWFVQRIYEGLGFKVERKSNSTYPEFAQNWPRTSIGGISDKLDDINSTEEKDKMYNLSDGLYVVGFCNKKGDNGGHMGFFMKQGENSYVIHSNPGFSVMVENSKNSEYYSNYPNLMLTKAFSDKNVINWMTSGRLDWIEK